MYDIINMTHYDRKSQHFTNSINQNTCMVRLPQCTNPCSFILVHAVVLADKLQKLYKLLLALGLHLVFVQTLAVVFQPVQQGVFLNSVARRCPMVALHKSIYLLAIDVPCFFVCHVILFWGSSIILRIKFKICKDSHFYLYCQKKHRKMCTALDVFLVFEDPCLPLFRIVAFVWSSFCTGPWHHQSCHAHQHQQPCRHIISHAMPIHAMLFPNKPCHPPTIMQPVASMARAARLSHCWWRFNIWCSHPMVHDTPSAVPMAARMAEATFHRNLTSRLLFSLLIVVQV